LPSLVFYDKFLKNQNDGTAPIDFDDDTIKVALCTAFGSATTSDFFDDVTELAAGNGYTAGGETLTITPAVSAGKYDLDATDTQWTFTAIKAFQYAVIYKSTGTAGTSPLIAYADLGSQSVVTTFDLTIDGAFLIRFAK
jgi:hypothetical protein